MRRAQLKLYPFKGLDIWFPHLEKQLTFHKVAEEYSN